MMNRINKKAEKAETKLKKRKIREHKKLIRQLEKDELFSLS